MTKGGKMRDKIHRKINRLSVCVWFKKLSKILDNEDSTTSLHSPF